MVVFTFWPNSGLGERMVTVPFLAIFRYPLIGNHSSGVDWAASRLVLQDDNQLKPIIIPPPARAVVFRKDRLP